MINESKDGVYYTYAMIKPDGMENISGILDLILDSNLIIDKYQIDTLDEQIIEENYPHCVGKDFYEGMKNNLLSGLVLKMVLYDKEGNAVSKYRKILGNTNSLVADNGTIRNLYGNKEVSFKNAAHGSGNEKEAFDEIKRFFGEDALNYYSYLNYLNKNSAYDDDNYMLSSIYKDMKKEEILNKHSLVKDK